MALAEAIAEVVAEVVAASINCFARKLGYSEVEAKNITDAIVLVIAGILILGLVFITFKYS